MFDFELKFYLESHLCEKCSHHTTEVWTYYFCNTACLMNWLQKNEIADKGFPCLDCRNLDGTPTGFVSGFESNGTCRTCNGAKRVKGHRLQAWETRTTSEAS
jgi:hypothetical protein